MAEDFFLERHALEHGLDDHIDLAEIVVAERRLDELQAFIHELLRKPAAFNRTLIVLLDGGQSAMKSRLVGLLQQHGKSGVGKYDGNSSAHRSGTDYRHRVHRDDHGLFRNVRDLGYFTLAEERMNEGLGLIREKALAEQFLFHLASRFKREPGGGFNRIDGRKWSYHAALFGASLFARGSEDRCVVLGHAEFVCLAPFTSFAHWFPCDVACKSYGAGQQIAFEQTIDEAVFQGFL